VARIGDIVEIGTGAGLAFAHFTHKHPQYGALLRVFSKVYDRRPIDITDVVGGAPSFNCFFPLGAALRRGIVSIVGWIQLSDRAAQFPVFRTGMPDREGNVSQWWLWDGEHEWRVGDLTPAQRRLSILGTINDTLLIDRILSGWTPELDGR
jgi:hypothetical protein